MTTQQLGPEKLKASGKPTRAVNWAPLPFAGFGQWLGSWVPAARQGWTNYWFGPGFALSYAFCRIAIGWAFLHSIWFFAADYTPYLKAQNSALYQPIGILYLFGNGPPAPELLDACRAALPIAAWALILGLFSRLSLVVGLFSFLCLASIQAGFVPTWSHQHPPILLPALALLVGPASPYSLDAVLRRLLGRPAPNPDRMRTAVLLGQMVVASIFFVAGIYKIYRGNGQLLAWCFSDNMRNLLLYQYWVLDDPMPAVVQFAVEHEWAYKAMATLNVLTQLPPLVACFLVRRPWLRLAFGACFGLEVYGLGKVMGIWNPHWLLLMVFFVDWEYFAGLVARKFGRAFVSDQPAPKENDLRSPSYRPAVLFGSIWIVFFLAFHLVVSLGHHTQRRFTYPFTSFPMYSTIYARAPLNQHLSWPLYGSRWDIEATPPLSEAEKKQLWRDNYSMPWVFPDMRDLAMSVKTNLELVPGRKVHLLRVEKTIFGIPPFPDNSVVPTASGLVFNYEGGKEIGFAAQVKSDVENGQGYIEVTPRGLNDPRYQFRYFPPNSSTQQELMGELRGNRFYFVHPGSGKGPYFTVVQVQDDALGGAPALCAGPFLY